MKPIETLPPVPIVPVGREPATVARDFEAVLAGQLVGAMFEQLPEGPGGSAEGIWRSELARTLGGVIARRGGLGLAPAVEAEIRALQAGK